MANDIYDSVIDWSLLISCVSLLALLALVLRDFLQQAVYIMAGVLLLMTLKKGMDYVKLQRALLIIEFIGLLITLLLVANAKELKQGYFALIAVPILTELILWYAMRGRFQKHLSFFLSLILRADLLAQYFLTLFKLSGFIDDVDWIYVLSPIWLLSVGISLYSIAILLLFLLTLFGEAFQDDKRLQVLGQFWLLFQTCCLLLFFVALGVKLLAYLKNNSQASEDLKVVLTINLVTNLLFLALSLAWTKTLHEFLVLFYSDGLSNQLPKELKDIQRQTQTVSQQKPQSSAKILERAQESAKKEQKKPPPEYKESVIIDQLPRYLKKFSSTYFLVFRGKLPPQVESEVQINDRIAQQQKIKEEEEAQQKIQQEMQKELRPSNIEQDQDINNPNFQNYSLQNDKHQSSRFVGDDDEENNDREEIIRKLDSAAYKCVICEENQPDSVFMQCGHGGICFNCANKIFLENAECHLCGKEVKQVLKIDCQQNLPDGLHRVLAINEFEEESVSIDTNN